MLKKIITVLTIAVAVFLSPSQALAAFDYTWSDETNVGTFSSEVNDCPDPNYTGYVIVSGTPPFHVDVDTFLPEGDLTIWYEVTPDPEWYSPNTGTLDLNLPLFGGYFEGYLPTGIYYALAICTNGYSVDYYSKFPTPDYQQQFTYTE